MSWSWMSSKIGNKGKKKALGAWWEPASQFIEQSPQVSPAHEHPSLGIPVGSSRSCLCPSWCPLELRHPGIPCAFCGVGLQCGSWISKGERDDKTSHAWCFLLYENDFFLYSLVEFSQRSCDVSISVRERNFVICPKLTARRSHIHPSVLRTVAMYTCGPIVNYTPCHSQKQPDLNKELHVRPTKSPSTRALWQVSH